MNKIKIIIIDSGVNVSHPNFENDRISGFLWEKGEIYNNIDDNFGHGTAVYGIIRSVKHFAEIINIKLKNIEKGVSYEELVNLLKYIDLNIDVNVINLSIGLESCECVTELYSICQRLYDKGTIILSAFSNDGCISYPAALDNVIGVCSDDSCWKNNVFNYVNDNVINLCAKGGKQRLCWCKPNYIVTQGNSFACAHATVQVAKFILEGKKSFAEIMQMFERISKQKYNIDAPKDKLRYQVNIRNAALFPFSKEMHSLVRYYELLPFTIKSIYDVKYSANIGLSTQQCMNDEQVQNLKIKNIKDIDWDEIDTLIIGHMNELSILINNDNLRDVIIKKALEEGKHIYCFDDIGEYGYVNTKEVYYPNVNIQDVPPNRLGMLYRISKPVVGVFGTSSRQGKFTLQLKLRQILLKQGYRVGQVGTEPSSLLFGFDYCYPMGYNSSVYIHEFEAIRYLNHIINELCMKDYEIIIAGSQSGTIPYDTSNIMQFPIQQQIFLAGLQPDCVILCINPFDEFEHVKRTIDYIESSVATKVISLVVFPMDIPIGLHGSLGSRVEINSDRYLQIKEIYESKLKIPVFKLGTEFEMEQLVESITDFFSD